MKSKFFERGQALGFLFNTDHASRVFGLSKGRDFGDLAEVEGLRCILLLLLGVELGDDLGIVAAAS
jgi:hypothetical protein